ncbi:MAG TPA: 3-carboxy-cis,cis-muconate cycloisomerase, partial [Thermodesulfobacteriota bacterium]|nr:3-carboxy-cis,cis-muconate cycloisomerase [Thermodesulfobacteriota bacterium]
MSTHPADSTVLGDLFGTPEMRALFADRQRLQDMLDVEAALARAEAAVGLVPAEAALAITRAARVERLDLEAIRASTARVGYPVVGLVAALARAAGPAAGRWVHWGATTQDILDTATMLEVRAGLRLVERDLLRTLEGLARLADRYRTTPMAGRTHLQHALPITFGYKCALWMQPLLAALDRVRELLARVPVVQFGGAVGTLAALGDKGEAVVAGLARELGLGVPPAPWHVDRTRLAEVVCTLGLLCGGLAKMATDVALLAQTEVAEVAEPHEAGRGGSSTMPQKRNPIASEYLLAAARGVHAVVPLMLAALAQDHERATGPWQSEALALPQAFVLTAGALAHAVTLAEGLVVDPAQMRRNLERTGGLVMAEAAMMALAERIGREEAHHLVEAACERARAAGRPLADALLEEPRVAAAFG